jgi:predicted GIY-YIG superfamily endonuclease
VFLKYSEEFETYGEARRREGELKRLTRAQKQSVIKTKKGV